MAQRPAGLTAHLAHLIAESRWSDFPPPAQRHAVSSFVNTVGCALGGSGHEAVALVEQALCLAGAPGSACVFGRATRADPASAALLNAASASVHAFDDSHARWLIHPGTPVAAALAAAAAVAGRTIAGKEFLLALGLGIEVACRISAAIAPREGVLGWSESGLAGAIGAAAASTRMLCSDAGRITAGIGIAASLASGLRVVHGTMGMHLIPAHAASLGVHAALLAWGGFTGPTDALEGRNGFLTLYAPQSDGASVTDGWGTTYELLSNTFKAYPCGIVIHPVIDACGLARQARPIRADEIGEVALRVSRTANDLANRADPRTSFEAQLSLQHWAAAALLHDSVGIEQLSPQAVSDPTLAALRGKCRVSPAGEIPLDAAEVHLTYLDGSIREYHIDHCRGSLRRPLSEADLTQKFLRQAVPVLARERATRLLSGLWALEGSSDVCRLWDP